MSKVRSHQLDIYGVELHLATNRSQWATLRRRLDFIGKAPDSAGLTTFAVWVPKGAGISVPNLVIYVDLAAHTDPLELVETCAHEAAHGANHILDWTGHDIRGSNEPHAYLVGWLTRWLWEGCAA